MLILNHIRTLYCKQGNAKCTQVSILLRFYAVIDSFRKYLVPYKEVGTGEVDNLHARLLLTKWGCETKIIRTNIFGFIYATLLILIEFQEPKGSKDAPAAPAKRILETIEKEEDLEAKEARLLQEAISSVPELDTDGGKDHLF